MELAAAINEIRQFWSEPSVPFTGGGARKVSELEAAWGRQFPPDLREYIGMVLPPERFVFEAVGNAIDVYGFCNLAKDLPGYTFNPISRAPIPGWSDDWVLVGDVGADPIVVDLAHPGPARPVMQAMHGAGAWDFGPIADSLGQFILLVAARHHALMMLPVDERITDDDRGYNLGKRAAEWFFPRVRRWAPRYYDEWAGVFDNA